MLPENYRQQASQEEVYVPHRPPVSTNASHAPSRAACSCTKSGAGHGCVAAPIYRDIDSLRSLGAVIDGEAGYGYTLIEDATLPPLGFDDEEIEALVLGLREVGQTGDPSLAQAVGRALSKLKGRLPPSQAHRLEHACSLCASLS